MPQCYIFARYVIHFKGALNSGEGNCWEDTPNAPRQNRFHALTRLASAKRHAEQLLHTVGFYLRVRRVVPRPFTRLMAHPAASGQPSFEVKISGENSPHMLRGLKKENLKS